MYVPAHCFVVLQESERYTLIRLECVTLIINTDLGYIVDVCTVRTSTQYSTVRTYKYVYIMFIVCVQA